MTDAQDHLKELETYWPKFITGTMIEAGCYLVLFPDLFNLAVILKTSVLLVFWMRGTKQWVSLPSLVKTQELTRQPLVFPKKTQSAPQQPTLTTKPPEQTQDQTTQPPSSSSSNKVTPEYLDFVKKELKKITGEKALNDEKIEQKLAGLQYPKSYQLRKNSEESLKIRGIPTFKVWKTAQSGAGGGGGQGQDSNPDPNPNPQGQSSDQI